MYVFDKKIGRRRFLSGAAAVAVAGTGAGILSTSASFGSSEHPIRLNVAGAETWGREAGEWIPSCCNMCGGQCGIMAHVVDGTVEKIEPNHWNPNNYANISTDFFEGYTPEYGVRDGGAICAKGNAGIMQLYDPDRITTPLKRTNPDKSPEADAGWEAISWDQALDEVAARMQALRDNGEAHRLLWMSEDHSFVDVQQDFCKLYGTPNYVNHSNICDVARKASFRTVIGDDRPLADFIQSKYIMLFGWNPTSAIKWIHLPRIITQGIERGARLVVVDPYLSDTAVKAHEWVGIRPSTDGALALALGHVIIRDELTDQAFLDTWALGFDEYAAYVADKTPAWAAEITGIKAETIERLAHELGARRPNVVIDVWSGPGQHSNGVQGGRAIAALSVLLGAVDRPGTMILPSRSGGKHADVHADDTAAATLKQPRFDELSKYPLGHSSGVYTQMFANLAEAKGPYQPSMMVCVFQNPVMSVPGRQDVIKALTSLETLVVVDTMLSETAMLADYVLPGTVYLERYDLTTHWVTWSTVGLRQPVIKPLFGQPAEYETVALLGRRLNLTDKDGKAFFEIGPLSKDPIDDVTAWYEDFLSNELKQGGPAMTLAELKALPGAVWVSEAGTKYEKWAGKLSDKALETAWYDGDSSAEGTFVYDKPKDDGGKKIGVVRGGVVVKGFNTPSRKAELVADWLAEKIDANGTPVDPLPVYTPREWQPDTDYPLYLINWKEANHTHTRTQNNGWLLDIKPDNPLVIHPDTAATLGIEDEDEVWIESPYGKVKGTARLSRRMHPEVVGLQHGFGHTALGGQAKGRGTADGWLRPTKGDPLSGQGLHKEACVRVSRA